MGFRDDLKATHARAAALEKELADAKLENAQLREQLVEQPDELKEPDPGSVAQERGSLPRASATAELLARRASRAVLLLALVMLAAAGICWIGHLGLVPAGLRMAVPVAAGILLVLTIFLFVQSLLSAGKAAGCTGSASDGRGSSFGELWLAVPFVLIIPIVGSLVGIVRAVQLLRQHPDESGADREARGPAAAAYVVLALCWPAMVASLVVTSMGIPAAGTIREMVRRTGRIVSVEGVAPVATGERCAVTIAPLLGIGTQGANCRVDLACNRADIYQGHARCELDGIELVRARADYPEEGSGGPASMDLDLIAGFVVVEDGGRHPYTVTIMIDREPSSADSERGRAR